jgi:two-component system, OmpR family, osmolarity sensor histidine kinase EnvZ
MAQGFHPFRWLKRLLPRGLFGRSLIIIVTPVVILQAIISYIVFERDLDMTTKRMARDVAADVAFLINLENTSAPADRPVLRAKAAKTLKYRIFFSPSDHIDAPSHRHHLSTIDSALDLVIAEQIGPARQFETRRAHNAVDIRVAVKGGVLSMIVPRERITVSNPDLFILWMVGSAVVLVGIAVLFLRNQVRPIERLAVAAEAFGRGRAVPDFKPYGASEVRSAAAAFLTMRARIERFLQQRTDMLAGVSHDLKTPLTRFRLQLAMMEESPDIAALRDDVTEMERMLDEYLAFARGEAGEEPVLTDLAAVLSEAAEAARRAQGAEASRIALSIAEDVSLPARRNALKRCLANLIGNALKHGRQVALGLSHTGRAAFVTVDDDGPGIPEARREEAFRPFHRLDQGRNLQKGGVGLGLAIARDIARAHGGDITLGDSPLGGLRASLRLPL